MEPLDEFPESVPCKVDPVTVASVLGTTGMQATVDAIAHNSVVAQLAQLADTIARPLRTRAMDAASPYAPITYRGPVTAAQGSVVGCVGVWPRPTDPEALLRWRALAQLAYLAARWKRGGSSTMPGLTATHSTPTQRMLFVAQPFGDAVIAQLSNDNPTWSVTEDETFRRNVSAAVVGCAAYAQRAVAQAVAGPGVPIAAANEVETLALPIVRALANDYENEGKANGTRALYVGGVALVGSGLVGRR